MDHVLGKLRKILPFGDFRNWTVRYTGSEIRQSQNDFSITISQNQYVHDMKQVPIKNRGGLDAYVNDVTLMKGCAGQLSWVANHSRPDQAFLASFLQGVQDQGQVQHLSMFNKAIREMGEQSVSLRFPSDIPIADWRLLVICDAGWATRPKGDSQGGYLLCICESKVVEKREPGRVWLVDWASKKLKRKVRSSCAAETLALQNGLDALELFQALMYETIYNIKPKQFRGMVPTEKCAVVTDSKSLYDALTRSALSSSLSVEKRLAIDYAIAKSTLSERNCIPCWVNNLNMPADCLTKLKGEKQQLINMLKNCSYQIKTSTQSGRKETAAKTKKGL